MEQSTDTVVYQSRIQELELQNLSLQQQNEALRISNEDLRSQAGDAAARLQEKMALEVETTPPSKPDAAIGPPDAGAPLAWRFGPLSLDRHP